MLHIDNILKTIYDMLSSVFNSVYYYIILSYEKTFLMPLEVTQMLNVSFRLKCTYLNDVLRINLVWNFLFLNITKITDWVVKMIQRYLKHVYGSIIDTLLKLIPYTICTVISIYWSSPTKYINSYVLSLTKSHLCLWQKDVISSCTIISVIQKLGKTCLLVYQDRCRNPAGQSFRGQ